MTPAIAPAFEAYKALVNNHYAGNETWSDNIHDLYRHIARANTSGDPQHVNDAIGLVHDIRAALNALETALIDARHALREAAA